MPQGAPPTAAPPSFYESLPTGGDTAAGAAPEKKKTSDKDGDLLKGAQGIYRVAEKMGQTDDKIKPFTEKIKEAVKALLVQGLKVDPGLLEGGEGKPPASAEPPAGGSSAPPSQTDETHAA